MTYAVKKPKKKLEKDWGKGIEMKVLKQTVGKTKVHRIRNQ